MSTENNTKEIFGRRLSLLMGDYDVTQVALAEAIGVAQSAISNYKRGDRIPPLEEAVKIARHFKVSVDYLLGWDGAKEVISPILAVAEMFAERFGENPEEQQKFFNDYVMLIHDVKTASQTLTNRLEALELKTRFLVNRGKPLSSSTLSDALADGLDKAVKRKKN